MGWFFKENPEKIASIINDLPSSGLTVMSLKVLDSIVPGQWTNPTNFDQMIRDITGDDDESYLADVKERVFQLYNEEKEGYQSAIWIYNTIESIDTAVGSAAMSDKLGEKVKLLSFLKYLTPKAESAQKFDFALKIIGELIAFTKTNGIPGDGIVDFVKAFGHYAGNAKIRMAGIICFDGILPLGVDFVRSATDALDGLSADEADKNSSFSKFKDIIPGDSTDDKLGYVKKGLAGVGDSLNGFVSDNGITQDKILGSVNRFIDKADTKLDMLSAFIDVSSDYYAHTGKQSVVEQIINRAAGEV
ncbi:hypothetical protein [Sediminitomix flava]|uniref:Uncharacterized protein n=1 Tax=Sediminitomix flava TaxID=379075 RepID=A0A315ZGV0_SEDFL|nr:hypothetical protein [Sediminitomix flava]PWJ44350.1 hypothetical protein BC781_101700 [Sediminitomix flava]